MSDYHILMADVIGSSDHEGHASELMQRFETTVQTLNDELAGHLISPYTITLGDEFQGIPDSLATALLSVVRIEELLIRNQAVELRRRKRQSKPSVPTLLRLRYVINFGTIETAINPDIAHGMLGRGLTEARRLLTTGKKTPDRVQLALGPAEPTPALRDALRLLFHFLDGWKPADAPIVHEFLLGRHYKDVARTTGLNQSSTFRRYHSLHIRGYQAARRLVLFLGGADPDEYGD